MFATLGRKDKPEGCKSKEGPTGYERKQKQQTITRLMTGACNWPFLSSQHPIKIGLVGTYSPYSRLLKAKRKLREKKAHETRAQRGSSACLRQCKKPTVEPKAGSPVLQPNILTTVSFPLEPRESSNLKLNARSHINPAGHHWLSLWTRFLWDIHVPEGTESKVLNRIVKGVLRQPFLLKSF